MATLAKAHAALLVAAFLAGCSVSRPATCRRPGEVSGVAGRVLVGIGEVIVGTDLVDHSHDGDGCIAVASQRSTDAAPVRVVPSSAATPRPPTSRVSEILAHPPDRAPAPRRDAVATRPHSKSGTVAQRADASVGAPKAPAASRAAPSPVTMRADTTLASIPARPGRWILVRKSTRTLSVFDADRLVKSYPVVLGADPIDPKVYEGDRRTPEGEYHVVAKHLHAEWQAFLLLDYPNASDVQQYTSSRSKGLVPLRGGHAAGTGGAVGIHGTVNDDLNRSGVNWTYGCISLLSADIRELYKIVPVGTLVVIQH